MNIPTTFISLDGAFKYGKGAQFWGYDGTKDETFCIELCTFVQCHAFVHTITCYYWILYNCFNWHNSKAPISFQGFFFVKGVLNFRDTNTVAEKYSRLCINLFIFRNYNMG
jgi:hypothetical protein